MKEGLETVMEYTASKNILKKFITSDFLKSRVLGGDEVCRKLLNFLEGRIFIHERYYMRDITN